MAINNIQMPINIKLNQNEAMSSAYGTYYLEVATAEVLSTEGLVNHITHHNCASRHGAFSYSSMCESEWAKLAMKLVTASLGK